MNGEVFEVHPYQGPQGFGGGNHVLGGGNRGRFGGNYDRNDDW